MVVWGLKELSGQLGRLLVGDAIVLGDVYRYAAGGIPVSYTHLDVYKRQAIIITRAIAALEDCRVLVGISQAVYDAEDPQQEKRRDSFRQVLFDMFTMRPSGESDRSKPHDRYK